MDSWKKWSHIPLTTLLFKLGALKTSFPYSTTTLYTDLIYSIHTEKVSMCSCEYIFCCMLAFRAAHFSLALRFIFEFTLVSFPLRSGLLLARQKCVFFHFLLFFSCCCCCSSYELLKSSRYGGHLAS